MTKLTRGLPTGVDMKRSGYILLVSVVIEVELVEI